MDTTRWKHGDEFAVLDLVAQFQFKTDSSLSFQLGTKGDSIQIPGRSEPWVLGGGRVFTVVGWLDVHHPCDGPHRLRLRVGLPDKHVCGKSMRSLVPDVIAALGLPADASYHVTIVRMTQQSSMEWPLSVFVSTGPAQSEPAVSPKTDELWTVYRQDDNGNVYVLEDNVSREEAKRLVEEFEARGHKQTYWSHRK
jgi:hypothetical protein